MQNYHNSIAELLSSASQKVYQLTSIWDCGVVVSHPLCMRRVPGSNPGESIFQHPPQRPERHVAHRTTRNRAQQHTVRGSIVVSISACHADDPGSIPGRGIFGTLLGSRM